MEEGECDVIFGAWSLYADFWNGWMREIRERDPDMPVVILTGNGGEREWLELLEAGAFGLLAFPCLLPDLLSVVEQAVVSYEVRKLQCLAHLKPPVYKAS